MLAEGVAARWSMPVRDYMSQPLIFVAPTTSLSHVRRVLEDRDISAVAVLEGATLAGILSSTDLLREARIGLTGPDRVIRITAPARVAADLMRKDVVCIDEGQSLREAAAKMVEHRIHRLVVLRKGHAAGVISTRDAMRSVLRGRVVTPLSEVMTSAVQTVDQDDDVAVAIERLDDANVQGLVVVDGEWPVGVFTRTEALRARALHAGLRDLPVERVMSYETICLNVRTPLYRVAGHALALRVRRILAVDERRLRGIVTGFDLMRAMVTGES